MRFRSNILFSFNSIAFNEVSDGFETFYSREKKMHIILFDLHKVYVKHDSGCCDKPDATLNSIKSVSMQMIGIGMDFFAFYRNFSMKRCVSCHGDENKKI